VLFSAFCAPFCREDEFPLGVVTVPLPLSKCTFDLIRRPWPLPFRLGVSLPSALIFSPQVHLLVFLSFSLGNSPPARFAVILLSVCQHLRNHAFFFDPSLRRWLCGLTRFPSFSFPPLGRSDLLPKCSAPLREALSLLFLGM